MQAEHLHDATGQADADGLCIGTRATGILTYITQAYECNLYQEHPALFLYYKSTGLVWAAEKVISHERLAHRLDGPSGLLVLLAKPLQLGFQALHWSAMSSVA